MLPNSPKSDFTPEWSCNFYGDGFPHAVYEALTVQYVPKKERQGESMLMQSKWFDYRLMHPMQATYYFMELYDQAYKNFFRKAISMEKAPFVRVIKEKDFLLSRERLSFWRLRRLADQLGMRYDFFLTFAMSHKYRMMAGGRVIPPRPSQIYSDELVDDALLAWEELGQSRTQFAQDEYFKIANFNGDIVQKDYEQSIMKAIGLKRAPQYALSVAIYAENAVRIESALQHFPQSVVSEAISLAMA